MSSDHLPHIFKRNLMVTTSALLLLKVFFIYNEAVPNTLALVLESGALTPPPPTTGRACVHFYYWSRYSTSFGWFNILLLYWLIISWSLRCVNSVSYKLHTNREQSSIRNVTLVVQVSVTVKRLRLFLENEELDPNTVTWSEEWGPACS